MWAGYVALANQQWGRRIPDPRFHQPLSLFIWREFKLRYGLPRHHQRQVRQLLAVVGYDLVTGWGSPNGQGLINASSPRNSSARVCSKRRRPGLRVRVRVAYTGAVWFTPLRNTTFIPSRSVRHPHKLPFDLRREVRNNVSVAGCTCNAGATRNSSGFSAESSVPPKYPKRGNSRGIMPFHPRPVVQTLQWQVMSSSV